MQENNTDGTIKVEVNNPEKPIQVVEPTKKLKKPLGNPKTAKAFVPEQEEKAIAESKKASEVKPAPSYSLIEDLKPAANQQARNAVSGTSVSYMPVPYMPFQQQMMGFPLQVPPMQAQVQMPYVPQQAPQNSMNGQPETDYNMMYQSLVNSGALNINPKIYNQLVPGQELQMNMQMHPGLQEYTEELSNMNQEELVDYYQDLLMQEYASRPEHSFGDHSHNGTYSDLNEEDFDEFEEEPTHQENPQEWENDPETAKRHAEIRKNFFNPDFKECECCKGYISNCGNEICINLGICHCVVRKQNEETPETNENELIPECQSCSCCYGFIYKCACAMKEGKNSCKCTT